MVRQPEQGKGTDDEEDEAVAPPFTLEHGTAETADDDGVAGGDDGEGQQERHERLKHVLENTMSRAGPVRIAEFQSDVYVYVGLHHAVNKTINSTKLTTNSGYWFDID